MRLARPKEPMALKMAKGRKHLTVQEMSDALASEIYCAEGDIAAPEWLEGDALGIFEREADYMRRVNAVSPKPIYGRTDVEALVLMSMSYAKYVDYADREKRAKLADRPKINAMKNKEASTYERFLRLLKLDPSSRVDFGRGGDADGGEDLSDI